MLRGAKIVKNCPTAQAFAARGLTARGQNQLPLLLDLLLISP
jgi:hypothetical protein